MIVKIIDAPAVPGGRAVALCDDEGEPLPMQRRAVIDNEAAEGGTITVTFAIDGDLVRFEG